MFVHACPRWFSARRCSAYDGRFVAEANLGLLRFSRVQQVLVTFPYDIAVIYLSNEEKERDILVLKSKLQYQGTLRRIFRFVYSRDI